MIVFDLQCHKECGPFEAWFRSSADYEEQRRDGLVQCPVCQSADVGKAPMAPRVPRKGTSSAISKLAAVQSAMLEGSRWVGDEFATTARAMHEGETEPARVHGNATLEQAKSLVEDGIPVLPLLLPVTPPNQIN